MYVSDNYIFGTTIKLYKLCVDVNWVSTWHTIQSLIDMLKSKVGNGNSLLSKGWVQNPFPWKKEQELRQLWPFSDYYCLMETNWKKKKIKQSVLQPVYAFTTSFSHYWTLFWIMRRDVKVQGIQVKIGAFGTFLVGMQNNAPLWKMVWQFLQRLKRPTIQPSIHASGYLPSWPEKLLFT